MKTTLKTTLAALSLAILATLTLSSCKTTGDNIEGSHNMGGPHPTRMTNEAMPGYH